MVSSSPTQNKSTQSKSTQNKLVDESGVLTGLKIELVEEALKKSQTEEDGKINRWLLDVFGK